MRALQQALKWILQRILKQALQRTARGFLQPSLMRVQTLRVKTLREVGLNLVRRVGHWAAWASYNGRGNLENRMKIAKNTVVSVAYQLSDAQGNLIEESDEPMVYLHGGYDGTFPKIEEELDGREPGFTTQIQLDPQDAFGEYDPELVKIEPRDRFPEPLEVGMQFEGTPEEADEELDSLVYTVTDVAEDKVVLDGNHPLAGMSLRFALTVREVREATEDEIEHEHAHGADGLEVLDEDEDDEEAAPKSGPTLH
jgi:FKBP-type peptidyl-prolyl cis-trans isomerase SlyD